MKPNERISLDNFYQLFGQHKNGDKWDKKIIHFLHTPNPDFDQFDDLSDAEIRVLKRKRLKYNKLALKNGSEAQRYIITHTDKVFFSDNFRTSYEYHGEVKGYDFLNSECLCERGKYHFCSITLIPSSEFIDKNSIKLFNFNVSKTLQKNNKAVLVSRAVLIYFDYFGIPPNKKELIDKIKNEYQKTYGESVKDNLIYDAIAVMSEYWNSLPKS